MQDLDMILDMCTNMKGVTICVLSDACAMPVEAMIRKFRNEFEYHITEKRCLVHAVTSPEAAAPALR
jgi:NADH-quinone oxidoreductase subunit F